MNKTLVNNLGLSHYSVRPSRRINCIKKEQFGKVLMRNGWLPEEEGT